MKQIIIFLILNTVSNIYSQDNSLTNYNKTLYYNSVYKIDLDTNRMEFQNYHNSSVLFDLNEYGRGRIILYYLSKHIFYIDRNYKTTNSNGSGTYFFITNEGNVLRLGITPDNYTSRFSLVLNNNTTISFVNK